MARGRYLLYGLTALYLGLSYQAFRQTWVETFVGSTILFGVGVTFAVAAVWLAFPWA
jgi:hypothetical protein